MTEIQQNRWDQLVRRVANVVGGGSQVNDTLNELFPTMDVENVPGELLALGGINIGWCNSLLQPSVGDTNHHQLFNPAGSGALIVITTILHQQNAVGYQRIFTQTQAIGTATGNDAKRDTRTGVVSATVAEQRTVQQAGGGSLVGLAPRMDIGTTHTVTDPNGVVVLFPGTGCTVATEATNVQSRISFMWRERVFEPAEDNF